MCRLGLLVLLAIPLFARHEAALCGTGHETANEAIFLHRQSLRRPKPRATTPSANRDAGNIAIIEDSDGVVAFPNEFNLDLKTLTFTPFGTHYRYAVSEAAYDSTAASNSTPLAA